MLTAITAALMLAAPVADAGEMVEGLPASRPRRPTR